VREPAAKRQAVAAEAGTTVLSVGAKQGEAYEPRAWETMADVLPLFDAGDYEGVKRLLLAALDRYDAGRQFPLYNLACAEAQLGETDAALEHLTAAVAIQPDMAEMAKGDTDFDPIRSDPRFPA
jgi:hypothetical protein